MITTLRKDQPFIGFELAMVSATAAVGQPVTVWLTTLFNQDAYTFSLTATGATKTKIADNEWELTYAAPGTYQVQMKLTTAKSIKKGFTLNSNIITVTIT